MQSASRQYRHRGSPQSGRIDAATLCAIGEIHNVDPLSVNFYLCTTLDLQRQTETEIEMVNLQWKNKY